jgi:hypothetical protein
MARAEFWIEVLVALLFLMAMLAAVLVTFFN